MMSVQMSILTASNVAFLTIHPHAVTPSETLVAHASVGDRGTSNNSVTMGHVGRRPREPSVIRTVVTEMKESRSEVRRPLSRRAFIKAAGVAGLGSSSVPTRPEARKRGRRHPGRHARPSVVPKFVTPLLIPPVMPRAATIRTKAASRSTTTRSR